MIEVFLIGYLLGILTVTQWNSIKRLVNALLQRGKKQP